jgi:hypothetical protein
VFDETAFLCGIKPSSERRHVGTFAVPNTYQKLHITVPGLEGCGGKVRNRGLEIAHPGAGAIRTVALGAVLLEKSTRFCGRFRHRWGRLGLTLAAYDQAKYRAGERLHTLPVKSTHCLSSS